MSFADRFIGKGTVGKILGEKLYDESHDGMEKKSSSYSFKTGIAKEVISNPYQYLSQIIDEENNTTLKDHLLKKIQVTLENGKIFNTQIKNEVLLENAPMNSIIAYVVDDSEARDSSQAIIAYPFFPSHFSLPVKPGEYVWLIREEIKGLEYYYWICRKSSIIQNEDVNYTNHERLPSIINLFDKFEASQGSIKIENEEILKATTLEKNDKGNLPNTTNMSADIFSTSFAFLNEHTGEPVPRIKKDCDDLLLQGSNNAGIHITKEKFKRKNISPTIMTKNIESLESRKPLSPALDLFVQRKYLDINQVSLSSEEILKTDKLNIIHNRSADEKYSHYEINKSAELIEGDNLIHLNEIIDVQEDALDVAGRIYISSNCSYDEVFKTAFDVLDTQSGPVSILYGKNTRVSADNNLRLTNLSGKSFIDMDSAGNIVAKSSFDSGQQFLSLGANGVTRLQAKNKIELAVRSNNSSPSEPYVIHSKLKELLTNINSVLENINVIVGKLTIAGPVGAVGALPDIVTNDLPPLTEALTSASTSNLVLLEQLGSTKIFGE